MAQDNRYRAVAANAAAQHGVPPAMYERQIDQESGFDPEAYNAASGASGIAQIVPSAHPNVNPWNPEEALDYAAGYMATLHDMFGTWAGALAAYNWGPGNLQNFGLEGAPGETRHYLTNILGPDWAEPDVPSSPPPPTPSGVTYNPDVPPERQNQSWVCSIRTAAHMLHTIGDWITAQELEGMMVPGLVDSTEGLHYGDGSQLAPFLAARSGLPAHNGKISWEWLQEHAGTQPIGMGSGSLYHWVGVRKWNPDGTLALNNPAPTYKGVGEAMTRASFEQWAPWYAVWLDMPSGSEQEDPAVIAELQAQVATLQAQLDTEKGWGTSIMDNTLKPVAQALDDALTVRGRKGWQKVQEARNSIRTNAYV